MPSAQYAPGYDPSKPPKPFEPPKGPFWQELKDRLRWLRNIAVFGFVIWILVVGVMSLYEGIDSSGWIQHQQETKVSWKGGQNWIVGEYRNCSMASNSTTELYCAGTDGLFGTDDPAHTLAVKYWGKIQRTNATVYEWKCQRKEESLLCWAVN